MALNYVTITGTFDDGTGTVIPSGIVTFTPSTTVYASGVPVATPASPIVAQIVNGALKSPSGGTLQLLATDNSPVTVEGLTGFWYWTVNVNIGGVTQSFSFFLPHTPTTVDLYALANTVAGGSSVSFPITIGQGGTGQITQQAALDAIAGGTTSGLYLRGNGTHVQLGAIQAADLPAGTGIQPWQFLPETYGAKGDGKVVTISSNSSTTYNCATIASDPNAVGKYVMIHGANGAAGAPVVGTIISVNSGAGTFVCSASAGATTANCPAVYGTDDVAAINAALAAAGTYAIANQFLAEILFGAKIYILATGPTQISSPTTQNSQLVLPFPNVNGTTQKLVIQLTGAGDAGFCQYWESLLPNLAGSCLVSMTFAPSTPSGTFGNQSVIGGPSGSAGFTGGYANVKVVVKGLSVWCSIWTNQYAYDFGYCSAMRVQQSSAHIFAPTGVNGGVAPYLNNISAGAFLSSIGSGFRTPVNGNNDDVVMDDVTSEGYECTFRVFDHFNASRLASIYADVVMFWNGTQGSSGTAHGIFVQQMSAENYNNGLLSNGGACQVDINWDAEGVPPVAADVTDTSNAFYGYFRYGDKIDNRAPAINGGANLKVINVNLGPGHWSGAPAVPGSTSARQNTGWRDAWVVIHTGAGVTVSVINIDGTVTGLTMVASSSVPVRVPSGKNITLTYAGGTPTWDWWLD